MRMNLIEEKKNKIISKLISAKFQTERKFKILLFNTERILKKL